MLTIFVRFVSKYTEYDNIFINYSLKFCNENFQPAKTA